MGLSIDWLTHRCSFCWRWTCRRPFRRSARATSSTRSWNAGGWHPMTSGRHRRPNESGSSIFKKQSTKKQSSSKKRIFFLTKSLFTSRRTSHYVKSFIYTKPGLVKGSVWYRLYPVLSLSPPGLLALLRAWVCKDPGLWEWAVHGAGSGSRHLTKRGPPRRTAAAAAVGVGWTWGRQGRVHPQSRLQLVLELKMCHIQILYWLN